MGDLVGKDGNAFRRGEDRPQRKTNGNQAPPSDPQNGRADVVVKIKGDPLDGAGMQAR